MRGETRVAASEAFECHLWSTPATTAFGVFTTSAVGCLESTAGHDVSIRPWMVYHGISQRTKDAEVLAVQGVPVASVFRSARIQLLLGPPQAADQYQMYFLLAQASALQ